MNERLAHLATGIVLLAAALANAQPSAPVGLWTMDASSGAIVGDSSPNKNNGTATGNPTWGPGQIKNCLQFDGTDDYVTLPIGGIIGELGDSSVAYWANWSGAGGAWQRLFDFGTGSNSSMFMTPDQAGGGNLRFAITVGGWTAESQLNASGPLATGWHHIAVVFHAETMTMELFLDGALAVSNTTALLPRDLGVTTQNWLGRSQYGSDAYYEGALDDFRIYDYALSLSDLPDVMSGIGGFGAAISPTPRSMSTDVSREISLGWAAGQYAATHDVYFGTSAEDVAAATRANPLNVLASKDQTAATFDPPGRLDFGQTYYWRVDEVNAPPSTAIYAGGVWSFTVEPYSYPVTGVTATASGSSKAETGPEKTVDGSGLDPDTDQHSSVTEDGWTSASGASAWIQYDLARAYKLDKMQVWNSNQGMEAMIGFGAKDVKVECSLDGTAWTPVGDFVFARAPGLPTYVGDIFVGFAGATARYVKLTITSNWGGLIPQYGFSEVRFYYKPVTARSPSPDPDPNAAPIHPQVLLSWRAGREAGSHEVYLDTDPNAVANGTVAPITVTQAQYDVAALLDQTYYWKVVEVNQTETPTSWTSDVWSFATALFISVDDFDSYTNNSPQRVFQTWIDGGGFSADEFFPNAVAGNGTGSFAGYDPALGDIMELTSGYDGGQSMPLLYDNNASPKISEATRTFATPQDWTKHGITTLMLHFCGAAANTAAPVYVKINDTKIVCTTISATKAMWQAYPITLSTVPSTVLKSVKSLTIGVGDGVAGGTGTILVDAIRLYAVPPQVATPTDPGTNGLAAMYTFENNAQDSSGKNLHGTANGEPGYTDGPAGMGKAIAFDGVNDYVELPIGNLISTMESGTFAAWVNYANAGNAWQRILDFGSSTTVYMFLTPDDGGTAPSLRFAITSGGNAAGGEQLVMCPRTFPVESWHHVAVTIDSATMTLTLYQDGVPVDDSPTIRLPKDLGVTTRNWLGRSQYTADPYLNGAIDDLRIYNRALSEGEIRYLAGDR